MAELEPLTERSLPRLLGAGAAVAFTAVLTARVLVHHLWPADPDLASGVTSAVASALSALACLYAALATRRAARRSWVLFTTTMTMWTTADVIWIVLDGDHRLVSVADWLYLLGLVPVAAALVLFPAATFEPGARRRLGLDVAVVGSSFLLCTQMLVQDEVNARVPGAWDRVVYGIYPLTDLLVAALAVLLIMRTVGRPRLDLVLIALAFTTWTLTDNGFALYSVRGEEYGGTLVALGYVCAPLLLGLAALASPACADRPRTLQRHVSGTLSALLPDLAFLGAVGVVLVAGLDTWQDWLLAAFAITCLGLRQVVLSTDNHALRHGLELRVAERTSALEVLSERHQRILDAVGEGVLGVERDGRISFVNPAAERLLGWSSGELQGRDACTTLCSEEHDQCVVDLVMALGDTVSQSRSEYVRRDGSVVPVEVTAAPRTGSTGARGAVVVFRDITEQQVMEVMKREFVSAVSHELRTPLTAIRGSLEMLADGDAGELPPAAHDIVEMASRGSERLTRLVNDIIDVERLESGTFSVRPGPQELAPLVLTTLASLQTLAEDAGVRLVAGDLHGRALCDSDRVVQALTNLVGNAVKFTPPGGSVRIGVSEDPHELTVAVSDEGRGIPAEQLEAVFDRFHQVHDLDSRQKGGSGLGLTITRSIVERHGGRIWVESTVGEGSTFRFTLPRVVDAGADPAPAAPAVGDVLRAG